MFMKFWQEAVHAPERLHAFSRNIWSGCSQLAVVMAALAVVFDQLALSAADAFVMWDYAEGLAANAPVVWMIGILMGLLSDLVLRKKQPRD